MEKLKKGDKIGLVAPASFVDLEKLESAIKNLKEFGFEIVLGESVKERYFSFAGEEYRRAEDINSFFADKSIKAIMCVRGGYGSIRVLDLLDYEIIKQNPKIFIGYSDITSINNALYAKCNLQTFHGPMAVSNFSGEYNTKTLNNFLNVVSSDKTSFKIENFGEELKFFNDKVSEGILVGGNMITLISNIGTEYDVDFKDKILFLEEIGESSYKVDRMLWQLKRLGIFEKVSGVILGDFTDCEKASENDISLEEVFEQHFKDYNKPVCYNFKSGHCEPLETIVIGSTIKLDGKNKSVEMVLNRIES